jgi:lipopolysaccharide export LptBFGC system permease protein LptF
MRRPGTRLRAIAARLCNPRTMQRVIDPTISDLQAEFEDARERGRRWEAARIWIAGHMALLRVIALHGGLTTMEALRDLPGDDRRAVVRTIAATSTIVIGGTLFLAMVPFMNAVLRSDPRSLELAVYLVPQVLPLSIPVGVLFGILWGLVRVSRPTRAVVLLLAFGASAVSFTNVAWLVPISNQAYRTSIAGQPLPKGDSELKLGELRQRLESGTRMALNYHARWALGAAPLALAVFAVAFASRRQWSLMSFFAGCVAVLGSGVVIYSARELGLARTVSPFAAAWVPNLAFLMLSAAIMKFRSPPTEASPDR